MSKTLILYFLILFSAGGLFYLGWQTAEIKVTPASLNNISDTKAKDLAEIFSPKNLSVKMVFVGDVMLSRGVANQIKKNNDFNFPFLKIADYLNSFDIAFGNLEGPISNRGVNQGSIYSFRADPKVVEGLEYAGFDVMSIANNHIFDWGRDALVDTKIFLEEQGIKAVGAGKDYDEANQAAMFEINNQKIAFLAYTNLYPKTLVASLNSAGISDFDLDKIAAEISALRTAGYLVVVSLHWGEEYKNISNDSQKSIAHDLIDSGASLVVGHHPHVVQEVEQYRDGWIAYSLGNFVFDQNFSSETMRGVTFEVEVRGGKVLATKSRGVEINSFFQPSLAE